MSGCHTDLVSERRGEGDAPLEWNERRFLFALGIPAFGLALSYTFVTTYVPVLLHELSGPVVTGIVIGAEGAVALIVPALIGGLSDQVRTRFGGRMPFVLGGAVLAVLALIAMSLFPRALAGIVAALMVFFVGYFVYYAPYYALYPDYIPVRVRGRSLGFQSSLRSAGMLAALVGGGLLMSLWRPLPFLTGALAIVLVTVSLGVTMRGSSRDTLGRLDTTAPKSGGGVIATVAMVRSDPILRRWAIANACWEGAIAALRTFAVLYLTVGLGFSLVKAASALALVGVAALLAAPIAGKLADRYGPERVMYVAVWLFAAGLLLPLFTTNADFLAAVLPVAFAAVVLMTLPYSVLMGMLADSGRHGAAAGLFGMSRGVGVIAGPVLAGGGAGLTESLDVLTFAPTHGYSAVFAAAALLLALSIPVLRRLV